MAEGKQLAVCIGLTKLSTQDMYVIQEYHRTHITVYSHAKFLSFSTTINKGVGIESIHYLGDGLWRMKEHV